jgi:hypothetical protein
MKSQLITNSKQHEEVNDKYVQGMKQAWGEEECI